MKLRRMHTTVLYRVNQATVFINFRTIFKFYFEKGEKKVDLNILKH